MANIITKRIIDTEMPLENKEREAFCNRYIELDVVNNISNMRTRRMMAYKDVFKDNEFTSNSLISSRSSTLMRSQEVSERISFLYEQEGSKVELDNAWSYREAYEILKAEAYSETSKPSDKLKAVDMLNKMKAIDVPKIEIQEVVEDAASSFLDKLLKKK